MTETTWPFPDRPGVPLNPKKPGIHWLLNPDNDPIVTFWACDAWELREGATTARKVAQDGWRYLGPCLRPEEIAAKDAQIAELERAVKRAAECIDADDAIGAHGVLATIMKKTSPRNPKWICPINHSGCVKNCGSYGCGN